MRGTFSSRQVSSLSRQAATSGSAEFLLPSTVMRPESFRPPSMRSVDMVVVRSGPDVGSVELAEVDDLFAQPDAEALDDALLAPLDQGANLASGGRPRRGR